MLWFFFDTSAIVKRFHKEKGTEIVDKIINSVMQGDHKGIISSLVILEFISAFRKRVSSKDITWSEFADVVLSFLRESIEHFGSQQVESGAGVLTDSVDYVIRHGLSAYDSIHMASMNRLAKTVEKSSLVLVSADAKLCESAEKESFKVVNPERITIAQIEEILKKRP